jgi:Protein-glutamine gamma-glutamyltransferase
METTLAAAGLTCRGVLVRGAVAGDALLGSERVLAELNALTLKPHVRFEAGTDAQGPHLRLWLDDVQVHAWAPGFDTLQLCEHLQLDSASGLDDLKCEIVVAMLIGPVAFEFPSLDELVSAVRIRCNIVQAARKTTLAFDTRAAERPQDSWQYDEDRGFIIRPGVSLISALIHATQPEVSGALYSFSCYRATEYVILLGIAQELAQCNPTLLAELQALWGQRPIKSGEFHDVFLREQGSMHAPLPPRYFVPGDRTWFRNPDEASSDASGFEGSWVMYLGGGLFTNFWKQDLPYTLAAKCLEIYHWRHALYFDAEGEERIDECKVDQLIAASHQDPDELARIMVVMQRYREARGVYTSAGGCIDTTREFARWVCPGTADLVLPTL